MEVVEAAGEDEEELAAVEALYGDVDGDGDGRLRVWRRRPPALEIDLAPYTAEDVTQQFVSATLVVKASNQYPKHAPEVAFTNVRGLEGRVKTLLTTLRETLSELEGSPMLVALIEAARERLTAMNAPEGDCVFCLMPLHEADESQLVKLMSCYHCFHRVCFRRWWLYQAGGKDMASLPERLFCPICRYIIHASDIAHASGWLQEEAAGGGSDMDPNSNMQTVVLTSELKVIEEARQRSFEQLYRSQKARGGIIEIKGVATITEDTVYIRPAPTPPPEASTSNATTSDQQTPKVGAHNNKNNNNNNTRRARAAPSDISQQHAQQRAPRHHHRYRNRGGQQRGSHSGGDIPPNSRSSSVPLDGGFHESHTATSSSNKSSVAGDLLSAERQRPTTMQQRQHYRGDRERASRVRVVQPSRSSNAAPLLRGQQQASGKPEEPCPQWVAKPRAEAAETDAGC
eukprot:jgi/Chlat1/5039/Chrsp329S04920